MIVIINESGVLFMPVANTAYKSRQLQVYVSCPIFDSLVKGETEPVPGISVSFEITLSFGQQLAGPND